VAEQHCSSAQEKQRKETIAVKQALVSTFHHSCYKINKDNLNFIIKIKILPFNLRQRNATTITPKPHSHSPKTPPLPPLHLPHHHHLPHFFHHHTTTSLHHPIPMAIRTRYLLRSIRSPGHSRRCVWIWGLS